MERTDEYVRLCQEESNALGRDGGIPAWTPLSSCLPALIDRSQFQQAATRLHSHIQLAREFVRDNMRDFIQVGRNVSTSQLCARQPASRSEAFTRDRTGAVQSVTA